MAVNPEPCTWLEWDSNFFGVRIARVNTERLEPQTTAQILDWCNRNQVRCLYFLADSSHFETLRLVDANGFYLTDIRVTLERGISGADSPGQSVSTVRPATLEDIPGLRAIAAVSYRDSRFYYDGHFSLESCDRLYATWIEKSISGYAQAVLVTGEPGQADGFVTCHINGIQGQIGLVGVDDGARGRGLGGTLVSEALRWFAKQGMTTVKVVTQGRNVAAQRLYQKCGFLTKDVKFWYHRWWEEE